MALANFFGIVFKADSVGVEFHELKTNTSHLVQQAHLSLTHRISKWSNAITFLATHKSVVLFGTGYGSYPGAMDGGLLKAALELGLPLLCFLLVALYRIDFQLFLVFCFSNILYDGYTSSATAPILIAYFFVVLSQRFSDVSAKV